MRHKFQGIQETQKSVKNSYYIAPLISTQSKFSRYSYIPTLTSVRCQWAEVFQISELSGLTVFYQDDHGGFCLQVTDIFKGQVSFDSFNYLLWGRNHWGYPNSLILIAKVIVQHSGSVYWTKIFHKLCSLTQPICGNNVKFFFLLRKKHVLPNTSYLWTIVISQFHIFLFLQETKRLLNTWSVLREWFD